MKISKNRKIEIENKKTAELYKNKISGFIDKNQLSAFIENEKPNSEIKVALGFCRLKDLKDLKTKNTFYFHAIKNNNRVIDFPTGILDAKRLLIYSGEQSDLIKLTGFYSEIKSIELKHKSKINGKANSETEYYYEVILEDNFIEDEDLKVVLNTKKLIEQSDEKNIKMLQQFLPALTTWENVLKSIQK